MKLLNLAVLVVVAMLALAALGGRGDGSPQRSAAGDPGARAPAPAPVLAPPPTPTADPAPVAPAVAAAPAPTAAVVVDPPAIVPSNPLPAAAAAPQPPTGGGPALGGAVSGWGPPPAPQLDPRPFSEVHWQGLELIPKTPTVAQALRLPTDVDGVVLDDVSLPADLQGFAAGDLITAVDSVATPNLLAFLRAADRVRDQRQVDVEVWRREGARHLVLTALLDRLGTANGETPTMIPPGARSPHQYQGPCTSCHRIGTNGTLATDQGDPRTNGPPPVRASSVAPHRDRGACSTCHQILP